MERLKFDKNGKLFSIDDSKLNNYERNVSNTNVSESEEEYVERGELKTSTSLDFLKDESISTDRDRPYWSLYSKDSFLEPLKFSNGKTQEDIVKEVVELVKAGNKIIFIHGFCGTGKSAIALNIARVLG